jgi:hypothetical protein
MPDINRHRVQNLTLELEMLGNDCASQVQDRLHEFLTEQALPQIESLLDEISNTEEDIRFSRLVIDAGEIKLSNWKNDLCIRLLDGLKDNLLSNKAARSMRPKPPPGNGSVNGDILFKQLLFFLRNGRLPWWGDKSEAALLKDIPGQFSRTQWQELAEFIRTDRAAIVRLVNFCSDDALQQLAKAASDTSCLQQVVAFFVPVEKTHVLYSSWRANCWISLLDIVLTNEQSSGTVIAILQRLFYAREAGMRSLSPNKPFVQYPPSASDQDNQYYPMPKPPYLKRGASERVGGSLSASEVSLIKTLPNPWRAWLLELKPLPSGSRLLERDSARFIRRLLAGDRLEQLVQFEKTQVPVHGHSARVPGEAQIPPETATEKQPDRDTLLDASVSVHGAGVILVHPFLRELFIEQQLLQASDFRSDECQNVAVHMLRYLTFGDIQIEEYDLLLPKLLCGMPWEQPLINLSLAAVQREACDSLLSAVLEHWRALKSQSFDFLRQQFFWRPGKLKQLDDGWKLSIEARAQDILLARLPWGTGVVRLPWMGTILHVDWDA